MPRKMPSKRLTGIFIRSLVPEDLSLLCFSWCKIPANESPTFQPLSVCTTRFRKGGSTKIQKLSKGWGSENFQYKGCLDKKGGSEIKRVGCLPCD